MTKEEAKEYIDDYISHIIAMTEYGNWIADRIEQFVRIAESECAKILYTHKCATTKKVCNVCKDEIDEVLTDLENKVTSLIEKEVVKLSEEEKEWLSEHVSNPLGLNFNFPDKASRLLMMIPIASAGIVGKYGTTISDRLRNIYEQQVMTSYVSGQDFEDIDYESKFNTFHRGLETDSKTLGSSLANQYDRIIYTANDNKTDKYMWLATLDTTTCLACCDLDHTVYSKIEDVPVHPLHSNCRCSICIINDEIEDVIPESYSKWFEDRDDDEKYEILGKSRYKLYKDGMKIKQFVNNGKITPLKDLKK